ncbi:hypothetical protein F751_6903 [Auxenochlorella protothecoides]|uniref:Uncharacterized protein n=1 Tax=Auxenochlorella protothecoides TaxID=3075 RepID=A0A087SDY1_AUXPR|nr:hypothetical protein F751_6903 [Auxenochlorella protothecoides]KFM23935.1 hypothetical protein F751_6903 [Auxenochlorella protothecoides]
MQFEAVATRPQILQCSAQSPFPSFCPSLQPRTACPPTLWVTLQTGGAHVVVVQQGQLWESRNAVGGTEQEELSSPCSRTLLRQAETTGQRTLHVLYLPCSGLGKHAASQTQPSHAHWNRTWHAWDLHQIAWRIQRRSSFSSAATAAVRGPAWSAWQWDRSSEVDGAW